MPRHRLRWPLSLLLLAAALLAGCGQKGALYLPARPGAPTTTAPAPTASTNAPAAAASTSGPSTDLR